MAGSVRRGDRETIGSGGLDRALAGVIRQRQARRGRRGFAIAVEGFQGAQRHALDVAADTALAETQHHPRLETLDDPRRDRRVLRQVKVEAIGPGLHQLLEHDRRVRITRFEIRRIDKQPLAQVTVDRTLAVGLGQAPQGVQVVGLNAPEVVLGLRVDQPEYRFGIGGGADMGDAPIVANDGDRMRFLLPALRLRTRRRQPGTHERGGEQCDAEQRRC